MLKQGSEKAYFAWWDACLVKDFLYNGVQNKLRLCLGCLQIWLFPVPQTVYQALWKAGGVSHAGPGQQLLLEHYALLTVELQCAGWILSAVLGASIWHVGQQLALSLPKLASSRNVRLLKGRLGSGLRKDNLTSLWVTDTAFMYSRWDHSHRH